jgi:Prokaryotic E2 family E
MSKERIERELTVLKEGGQSAEYFAEPRPLVLYRAVPTAGDTLGLPAQTDVLVPVPPGYPASMIDLAGLPVGSPLLGRVKGGQNNQGIVTADGRQWQLASYHPHNGRGGAPWDQSRHGFHTYFDHLISWLDHLG